MKVTTMLTERATQEALAATLANNWPSSSLWSDEAGIILGSQSMQSNPTKFVALLNRLWDGKVFTAHRKSSPSFMLKNRRLTVNLMMQPLLLQQLTASSSGIHRQSGFLARCLMAYPNSSMGTRFYQEPPQSFDNLDEYESRLEDCLNISKSLTHKGCLDLPTLKMSASAKSHWIKYFNNTESGISHKGQWSEVKDFASKSSENAARLSALFHLFGGCEGDISAEHMESAITIVEWHLQESRRILGAQSNAENLNDAQRLLDWLVTNDRHQITPREIQQLSPLRNMQQRDNALEILIEHQTIKVEKVDDVTFVIVNPKVVSSVVCK